MAAGSSDKEIQNFYRLSSLLIDIGTASFRKLLMKYVLANTTSLEQHLQNNQAKLNQLFNKRILNQAQLDILFPATGKTDIETYDITLINCLIRNTISKVKHQEQQELDNVRTLRNNVCSHVKKASVDDTQFNNLWTSVTKSIAILAQGSGDPIFVQDTQKRVTDLETDPKLVPSSVHREKLLEWYESDKLLSEQLEQHHEEVKSKFESLQKASTSLTEMVSKRNEEMAEMTKAFTEHKLKLEQINDAVLRWSGVKDQCLATVDLVQQLQDNLTGHSKITQKSLKRIEENQDEVLAKIKQLEMKNPAFERLKSETKNALITLDDDHPVCTAQFEVVENKLETGNLVFISGGPGDGKTTTGLRLLKKKYSCGSTCLILKSAADFDNVDLEIADYVLIDDIFGSYNLNFDSLKQWSRIFQNIKSAVTQKKVKIIITSHSHIVCQIKEYRFAAEMETFLFKHKLEVSSSNMSMEEKTSMLQSHLEKQNKSVSGTDIEDFVEHYNLSFGFPACCEICLHKENAEVFLEYPYEFILKTIEKLAKSDQLTLLFLFAFHAGLHEEQLNESKTNENTSKTLADISKTWFGSVNQKLSLAKIRQILGYMRSVFTDFSAPMFSFASSLIYDSVGLLLSQKDSESAINYCSMDFLLKFFRIGDGLTPNDMVIYVKEENCDALAKRYVEEASEASDSTLEFLLYCEVFKSKVFVQKFFEWLKCKDREEPIIGKVVCHSALKPALLNQAKPQYNQWFVEQLVKCLRCYSCQDPSDDKEKTCWKCDSATTKVLTYAYQTNVSLFRNLLENTAAVKSSILSAVHEESNIELFQTLVTELIASGKWERSDGPTVFALRRFCSHGKYALWKTLNKRVQSRKDLILQQLQSAVTLCRNCKDYDSEHYVQACEHKAIVAELAEQLRATILHVPLDKRETIQVSYLMGSLCKNGAYTLLTFLISAGIPVSITLLLTLIKHNYFHRDSRLRFDSRCYGSDKEKLRQRYQALFTTVLNILTEKGDWHPGGKEAEQIMNELWSLRDDSIMTWTYHKLAKVGFSVTSDLLINLTNRLVENDKDQEGMFKDIVRQLKSSRSFTLVSSSMDSVLSKCQMEQKYAFGYFLADAGFLTSPGILANYMVHLQTLCIGFDEGVSEECPHQQIVSLGVNRLKLENKWKRSETNLDELMIKVCQYSRYDWYRTLAEEGLPVSKKCLHSLEHNPKCTSFATSEIPESNRKLFRMVKRAIVVLKPEIKAKHDFSECIAQASKRGRKDLFELLVKDSVWLNEKCVIDAVVGCCTCKKPIWYTEKDKRKDKVDIANDIRQKLTDSGEWDENDEEIYRRIVANQELSE